VEAEMIENHVSFPLLPTDGSAKVVMPSYLRETLSLSAGPAGSFTIRFIPEQLNCNIQIPWHRVVSPGVDHALIQRVIVPPGKSI
jgi:hypothetical protein